LFFFAIFLFVINIRFYINRAKLRLFFRLAKKKVKKFYFSLSSIYFFYAISVFSQFHFTLFYFCRTFGFVLDIINK